MGTSNQRKDVYGFRGRDVGSLSRDQAAWFIILSEPWAVICACPAALQVGGVTGKRCVGTPCSLSYAGLLSASGSCSEAMTLIVLTVDGNGSDSDRPSHQSLPSLR